MTVGDRIKARRLELGLSQRNLATAGVSSAYISRIEVNQRQPSTKALRQLAPRLGVSVHWLETGKADPGEELARLVLDHKGGSLPSRAMRLARRILETR